MREIALPSQLRMSYLRWALLTVPLTVLLGFLSGQVSNTGDGNSWYAMLVKPALQPPAIAFPVAWTLLYILIALALALVLNARRAVGRRRAVALWLVQFALNLAWSPVFFGMHKSVLGLVVILAMLAAAVATTFAFARVRDSAAWLMLPYLAWLSYAAILNLGIVRLNPGADGLAANGGSAQIPL